MPKRPDRDLARAVNTLVHQAARQTRATTRGNVDTVNEDGSAEVILPNGGVATIQPTQQRQFAPGQSIVLFRTGNNYEMAGASGYSGGKGALFEPPGP